MRHPISVLRAVLILFVLGLWGHAHADDRGEARAHYQTAVKLYSGGDYRGAIREFSAAQQLVPADLNNYNLALCYDKLGDAEPAIQYYRAFLDKQPNTDKRAEIEASVSRLEAAARSAAGKKAEEARNTRRGEAPPPGPVFGPPPPPSGSAPPPPGSPSGSNGPSGPSGPSGSTGDAGMGPPPPPSAGTSGDASVGVELPRPHARKPAKGPAIAGSIGTPSSGTPVPRGATGDSQLDRVNSINIDDIREQRVAGGMRGGMNETRGEGRDDARDRRGPAVASAGSPAPEPAPPAGAGVNGAPLPGDEPKKATPVYKKWWFWAVVAVGAYVVYELATTNSSSSNQARTLPPTGHAAPPPGGLTLLRW